MASILSDFSNSPTPTQAEVQLAHQTSLALAKFLNGKRGASLRICIDPDKEKEEVAIPVSALRLLNDILTQMAKGNAVKLMPVQAELTTQQAADLLKVSRPFLVEQLEKHAMPFRKVGTHRRILLKDLMEFKQKIDRNRLQALDELSALDQELGFDR